VDNRAVEEHIPSPPQAEHIKKGAAGELVSVSHYGGRDGLSGKKTASGEIFDPNAFTCAHRSLPFGTKLELSNPETGKIVTVRVNDRGPFVRGRTLDLSARAAKELGITGDGIARVQMRQISDSKEETARR